MSQQQTLRPPERRTAFNSPTFNTDAQIRVSGTVGSASISPSGRDVVLASREGLHIVDLDSPYSPPRHLAHHSMWDVADVQWSPFASKDYWVVSTSNQKALVWNLNMYSSHAPIEHVLHAHSRAITDINFSAHDPEMLATCAVDSYVHCWDLRQTFRPAMTFADWNAGATQVKWNRQDSHILASSHDRQLKIWDTRKGAQPLRTIVAHSTKIYGVDWNRIRQTGIVTCSLDRTIKFWDYSKASDEPERIIRTTFPVWRARHTPFGWGLLAMPQRGDNNLYLFDRRLNEGVPIDGYVDPVHSFTGHHDVVKEFLWRSRGSLEDGKDERDFQLVSWGADRDLHLHQIESRHLRAVGHEKGKEMRKKLFLTRLGAVYKSYRDDRPPSLEELEGLPTRGQNPSQGIALLSAAFKSGRLPHTVNQTLADTGYMTAAFSTLASRIQQKNVNPMTWIEGVKIGGRSADQASKIRRASRTHVDTPEPLSDEMMFVSRRYKKVTFEKADVHGREAVVTLHGPWGTEERSVFLRINFTFPEKYPEDATPAIRIERSTSTVADETMQKLHDEVYSIVEHFRERHRGSLEAVITYLLGEKDLHASMIMIPHDGLEPVFPSPADELSSDEEDGLGPQEDLAASGTITTATNVPLPRTCGALWAGDGQLVCFFPPKVDVPVFSLDTIRAADKERKVPREFEGFGRLRQDSNDARNRYSDDDEEASSNSWTESSSSSSSGESEDLSHLPARFKVPLAWRPALIRSLQKPTSQSSGELTRKARLSKSKTIIAIHNLSDALPAKRSLAQDYITYGNGPSVCEHNAAVALRHGLHTLSAVWELCQQILYDEIPLAELEQSRRRDPILVLAKRNVVRIKRKDSGLDLGFDEPDAVAMPRLTGRVKWGCHPLASTTLIPALFDHFEKQADTQMLAMLSCIFCEPAAQEGTHNALLNLPQKDLPIAAKAPGFSLDYFPSREVAWSQYLERKATPRIVTPAMAGSHAPDYFSRYHNTYGSLGSSNGPWLGDGHSDPHTPFSIGNTPPLSRRTTVASSLSTSPEPNIRASRRSNSSLSTAFASFSRPFTMTMSASPPVVERTALERTRALEVDLSTSAPTTAITWGMTTSFGSSPNSPMSRRRSNARSSGFGNYSGSYQSDDDAIEDMSDNEDHLEPTAVHASRDLSPVVRLTLKNQHLFDDEGYASVALLDASKANIYASYRDAYADLLGRWRLHVAQAEILKFNGLTPYWPAEARVRAGQPVTTSSGAESAVTKHDQPGPNGRQSSVVLSSGVRSGTVSSRKNSQSPSRPLNPTALPFVPQPQLHQAQGGMTRLAHSSSQADLQDLLTQANAHHAEKSEGGTYSNRDNLVQTQNTLLQQATDRARLRGEKANLEPQISQKMNRACLICWEYITGMYIICSSGQHRAHADCVEQGIAGNILDCGCTTEHERLSLARTLSHKM